MDRVSGIKQLCKWLKKQSKTNIQTLPQKTINRVHRIEYKIRININKRRNCFHKFSQETSNCRQMWLSLILRHLFSHISKYNMKRLISWVIVSLKLEESKVLFLKIGSLAIAQHLQMKGHLGIKHNCKRLCKISNRYRRHKRAGQTILPLRPKRVKGTVEQNKI